MTDKDELTQRLLRDPFDLAARESYAKLLFDAGAASDALTQWELVAKQSPGCAAPQLEAARCCQKLGRPADVEKYLRGAESSPDFDAGDERITELRKEPGKPGPVRLRALQGGREDGPSAKVIPFTARPNVRFADVVGMAELKKLIRLRIIEPFVNPGLFARFRRRAGGGVLLYGPPGCGKTLIARAIAGECRALFISVGISEIMSMWIGESESNLAGIFEKARSERPAVLFFDELDALAFSRSKAQSEHTRRLVNEFLNQLDGLQGNNDQLLVLAATNMPWDVDGAMKRPGRFDRQFFVPPPDAEARTQMLRVKLDGTPAEAIDYARLAGQMAHFSGADIDGVVERAKDSVLGDILDGGAERALSERDLDSAIAASDPSTLEWLRTARNLVKFGGRDAGYKDVEQYLRESRLF
jgi:AAA+ superfamily predicted ATPase